MVHPHAASAPVINNGTFSAASGASWYFLDSSNATRGPYDKETMKSWSLLGYFPPNTKVRNGHNQWIWLSQLGPDPFK